ncbi:caspase family protein [Limnohabitans sp. DM1]|uniref:caspase family protein n=1 Tax=Limnohabitans sp. DM1 TaxID=1597955 RepID=UPI0018929C60|nr:caspase family protein [Limnohabitans sp. DM1]
MLWIWGTLLHSAWAVASTDTPADTSANALQWALPVEASPGKPLPQTKFSGPRPGLWLEVNALQKVLVPADGTLLYAGGVSASQTGFVIGHPNGWISLIASPMSWERTAGIAVGAVVRQGQELAVVRGGRAEILRQLNWSVFKLDEAPLRQELMALVPDAGEAAAAIRDLLFARLLQLPAVNAKGLLGLGSLQLGLNAGNNLEDCTVRFVGVQMPCRSAEQQDFLLPVGVHKLEVQSGRVFKSTNTTVHFISLTDTIVQNIEKDDRNNYLATAYAIDRSELKADSSESQAQAQAQAQALKLEQDRQLAAAENLKRQKEAETLAQAQALKLEQDRQLAAAESLKRQKEAEALAKAQALKLEQDRQLAAAENLKRQKEAEALAKAQALKLEQDRQLAAAENLKRQKEAEALAKAQALKLEQDRQLAAAESLKRQKEDEALAQERLAQEARQRDAQEILRVNAELSKLKEQLSQIQAQKAPVLDVPVSSNDARTGMRRALIMGNDAYKDVAVLQNARSDARAMSKTLGRLGFEVSTHLDLTERGMKEAIRTFKSQIRGGDEVVVFFAGHGVQLGATNYLLPVDIRGQSEDQVRDEAIPLQRLLDDFQDTKARFALAIIDACRDNPFKTAGRAIGGRGLASTSAATGQMVMFSAGTGQQALDRLGPQDREPHGLFTRVLLKEIDKPGVSIERLVRNVRNEVARLSKTVGHEQVPAVYDQTLGDFFFRP